VTAVADLLGESPLFAHLDVEARARIAERCTVRHYEKGETICAVGDAADELLIIAEGEVAVWAGGSVVAHLGRPAVIGEIALLLREARSATITASRPSRVVALEAVYFDELARGDMAITTAIGHMLAARLRATTHGEQAHRCLVVAVASEAGQRGVTLIASYLQARLVRDLGGEVAHVVVDDAPDADGHVFVRRGADRPESIARIARVIDELTPSTRAIVVELNTHAGVDIGAASSFADVIVELARSPRPPVDIDEQTRVLRVRNHADGSGASHVAASARSLTIPFDAALAAHPAHAAVRLLIADERRMTTRALDRLARAVERRVVGVALGSGAALGLAHVGALRELEDAGIPIDVVAGSSMGGVIAAGYATGCTARELEARAVSQSSFLRLLRTVEPAVTGDGLLAGNQLVAYLRPFLDGARTFADLVLPTRVVATDLIAGDRVPIGDGDLESAVRATVAMPPFITPLVRDGRTLVDGGIVDPIPVDVVRDLGADIVIAISAIPKYQPNSVTALTRASRILNRFNPFAYVTSRARSLNLLDIVMGSFHIVEHRLGERVARDADIFIEPDLASHTWIEFYRAAEIIERGAEATRNAIPEIEAVLSSRLAATFPVDATSSRTANLRVAVEPTA
jgi:NTE family protein